jgi:hypothetical protein
MLALPALPGQEKAKDEKKDSAVKDKDEKKQQSAKEQYAALMKEFGERQRDIIAEVQKTKGPDRQKLIDKYYGLGKEFADKFYKLAEDNPKDPVAADALFWIMQNAADSEPFKKAGEKVTALIAEMPLKDLSQRLNMIRGGNPAILDAVSKRIETEQKDPAVAELLVWMGTNASYMPAGQKAIERLIEKYPDHPAIERICMVLGRGGVPKGEEMLKTILEKNDKPRVKAAAALELGRALAAKTDKLGDNPAEADKVAAEGEKYLTMAIDLNKDNERQMKAAEGELKALRTLRVGKEAPEIKAGDLDGKEFKLTDYRGKVVMLDFWGHW